METRQEILRKLLDELNSERQEWAMANYFDEYRAWEFLAGIVQAALHELAYGKQEESAAGGDS